MGGSSEVEERREGGGRETHSVFSQGGSTGREPLKSPDSRRVGGGPG